MARKPSYATATRQSLSQGFSAAPSNKPEKQRKDPLTRLVKTISVVVLVVFVLLAAVLVGPRAVGLRPFAVLSGSMEPAYHVGSLIYVGNADPFELKVGDPVTFLLDEDTIATHRIVEVIPDPTIPSVVRFRTQGDANDCADSALVHCNNVIGTPVATVPYMGYVAHFVQTPPGLYVVIAFVVVFVALMFVTSSYEEENERAAGKSKAAASRKPKNPRRVGSHAGGAHSAATASRVAQSGTPSFSSERRGANRGTSQSAGASHANGRLAMRATPCKESLR